MKPSGCHRDGSNVTEASQDPEGTIFGNACPLDHPKDFRVMGWNCRGIPQFEAHEKNGMIRQVVNSIAPDVLLLSEINTAQQKLE